MSEPVVIGLGGNIGTDAEIVERFRQARTRLAERLGAPSVASAPLYRTAPIGPAQPAFLNTAVALATSLAPEAVIAAAQAIEAELGRVRDVRWGPRTIDLDVLAWGARTIHVPGLDVPHPRLHERRFALQPLVDLAGADFAIPGAGRAGDALARVADQALAVIAPDW